MALNHTSVRLNEIIASIEFYGLFREYGFVTILNNLQVVVFAISQIPLQ